jgi:hypothetical protein
VHLQHGDLGWARVGKASRQLDVLDAGRPGDLVVEPILLAGKSA